MRGGGFHHRARQHARPARASAPGCARRRRRPARARRLAVQPQRVGDGARGEVRSKVACTSAGVIAAAPMRACSQSRWNWSRPVLFGGGSAEPGLGQQARQQHGVARVRSRRRRRRDRRAGRDGAGTRRPSGRCRAGIETAHVAHHRQQGEVGDAAEVEHGAVFGGDRRAWRHGRPAPAARPGRRRRRRGGGSRRRCRCRCASAITLASPSCSVNGARRRAGGGAGSGRASRSRAPAPRRRRLRPAARCGIGEGLARAACRARRARPATRASASGPARTSCARSAASQAIGAAMDERNAARGAASSKSTSAASMPSALVPEIRPR